MVRAFPYGAPHPIRLSPTFEGAERACRGRGELGLGYTRRASRSPETTRQRSDRCDRSCPSPQRIGTLGQQIRERRLVRRGLAIGHKGRHRAAVGFDRLDNCLRCHSRSDQRLGRSGDLRLRQLRHAVYPNGQTSQWITRKRCRRSLGEVQTVQACRPDRDRDRASAHRPAGLWTGT
jgi:hypothetical protein